VERIRWEKDASPGGLTSDRSTSAVALGSQRENRATTIPEASRRRLACSVHTMEHASDAMREVWSEFVFKREMNRRATGRAYTEYTATGLSRDHPSVRSRLVVA